MIARSRGARLKNIHHASQAFIAVLLLLSFGMLARAQDYSSPEAAFREHQAAWANKSIDRFLATISFQHEALEELMRASPQGTAPDASAVRDLAAKREADLHTLLQARGFIATDLAKCKIVTKWQDSNDQVRFPLSCAAPNGSLAFTIRLVRVPEGWRIVRGR
jgi:hypothetical protein